MARQRKSAPVQPPELQPSAVAASEGTLGGAPQAPDLGSPTLPEAGALPFSGPADELVLDADEPTEDVSLVVILGEGNWMTKGSVPFLAGTQHQAATAIRAGLVEGVHFRRV